jgi:hypothetical protein
MPALEHTEVPHDLEGIRKVVENLIERVGGLGTETTGDLDEDNINGELTDTKDHPSLIEVTSDQHHSQVHDVNGPDHSPDADTWHDAISGSHGGLKQGTDPTDAAAATASDPVVSSLTAVGGSGATTGQEGEINTNFSNIDTEINALIADVADIRTQLNTLLANMRTASQID